jgi:hypothetical protein
VGLAHDHSCASDKLWLLRSEIRLFAEIVL